MPADVLLGCWQRPGDTWPSRRRESPDRGEASRSPLTPRLAAQLIDGGPFVELACCLVIETRDLLVELRVLAILPVMEVLGIVGGMLAR
jgi:hypothetical protein